MRQAGLILAAICLFLLTGCVEYDLSLDFKTQHQGKIVQNITLSKQLTTINQRETEELLRSINNKVRQLHGQTKKISPQEIVITIPFNNGKDLVSKFSQFFTPKLATNDYDSLLLMNTDISLEESNFLLLQREKLKLLVDLTSLGVFSQEGNLIVSPETLLNLNFSLKTPFGAKNINKITNVEPEISQGKTLLWHLQPGKINEIEVVFWIPSVLGIGSLLIILLMIIGFYFKYRRLPWVAIND
ncbi:MAG: DUF3153 domain-containing protein [Gloeocapsa sp. DLM2.Bin57]|nr:MAG: DUF3153 domain-containing protein [Gloeocapsa sp. DLM2.Bin57]